MYAATSFLPRAESEFHRETGVSVIRQEAGALDLLADSLDHNFGAAVRAIFEVRGRLVVAGMGKAGHIGRKIAATLSSTGSPAFFIHPSEAAHGDLGMVRESDVLLALSNSGTTSELLVLARHVKAIGSGIIAVTQNSSSRLASYADVTLLLPQVDEACPERIAPTTSSTMMLALGDALAIAVMRARGFSRADLMTLHPGGSIGWNLQPIERLIQRRRPLPLVKISTSIHDVVLKMTGSGMGAAGVLNDKGDLIGVVTDGDLRRGFDKILSGTAGEIMSHDPKTLHADATIGDAAALMAESKITVLFVTDPHSPRKPVGIVQIHDLTKTD